MWIRTLITIACVLAGTQTAFAEPPSAATKSGTAHRGAEKLDRTQSRGDKADRIVTVPEVEIQGKPRRPLVTVEVSVKPFDFPVGTARYSNRDQHFLQTRRRDRW